MCALQLEMCGIDTYFQWQIQDFPYRDAHFVGERQVPTQLRFIKFVCQNERIGTLRGGARPVCPLDPPLISL